MTTDEKSDDLPQDYKNADSPELASTIDQDEAQLVIHRQIQRAGFPSRIVS